LSRKAGTFSSDNLLEKPFKVIEEAKVKAREDAEQGILQVLLKLVGRLLAVR